MKQIAARIAAFERMNRVELREVWVQFSGLASPNVPLPVLRQLTAYKLQERKSGKLKASVRRELERLAMGRTDDASQRARAPKLSPGTRLVREWNGQTLVVEVLGDGFWYNDQSWNSLSEIARHVTGSHWSGPRFFGLHKNG